MKTTLFCFFLFAFLSCESASTETKMDPILAEIVANAWIHDTLRAKYVFPYDLTEPNETFEMPNELEEISGLGITASGKYLIAVQDEKGEIYYIKKENGKVKREVDFHKDGDYEGVEVVGEEVFVLKSSGTLYRIKNPEEEDEDDIEVEKYNDYLDSGDNVEGLAWDRKNNRLLLACKGKVENDMRRNIYAFNLNTYELDSVPAFVIGHEAIWAYLETKPSIRKVKKVMEFFQPGEHFELSPSALAIHPQSENLYILSSVGKLLVIINQEGKLVHIEKLDKKVHTQPEGIVFDENGTLYISNEGKGDDGEILQFNYLSSGSTGGTN